MRYEIKGDNTVIAHLEEGEHLAFLGDFLRDHRLGSSFPPIRWQEALIPRVLTGRLFFSNREAWESESIRLSGNRSNGRFHPVEIPEGKAYCIKLSHLAAFSLGPGARFKTLKGWLDPVKWLTGITRSVVVYGPANLLFYGEGLTTSTTREIYADSVVAFDATLPFNVSGYDPGASRSAHFYNAMSSTVVMSFSGGRPLLQTTLRSTKRQRIKAIARTVVSVALGYLATRAILGK